MMKKPEKLWWIAMANTLINLIRLILTLIDSRY